MTFTLPENVAAELLRAVPARERSRYVTGAITDKLRQREDRLIQACERANRDPEVLAIEREWDALTDEIADPWKDSASR